MYIAVAGNIGSGKTSLSEILSQRCGFSTCQENEENPYIGDFYEDMNRWAFNLQVYFLGSRIRQAQAVLDRAEELIQDRTIYEDANIFAANLHNIGLISSRDFQTYMEIYDLATGLLPQPDLLIYLKASVPTLISQIQKRGRAYEMSIQEDYLDRLNQKYKEWIDNIYEGEVFVIDIDHEDFVMNPAVIDRVIARIDEIRHGKVIHNS